MIRRVGLIVCAMAVVLIPTTAFAQDDYEPDTNITVDDPTPDPGQEVTVSGSGCTVGAEVTISFDGEEVATTTTDENGEFSASFEVPDDTVAGTYAIEAAGCTAEVLSASVTVLGATAAVTTTVAVAAAGDALPVTGSDSTAPLVRAAVVLLAVGGLLVFAARRRGSLAGS